MSNVFRILPLVASLLREQSFGLIVDVDGTIAPIASAPDLAKATPACRQHLRALSKLLPLVAAISGRPATEARQLVGVPAMVYVGNHGLDRWEKRRVVLDSSVAAYRKPLLNALKRLKRSVKEPGIVFEDKGATLSIHYRLAVDPEAAERLITQAAMSTAGDLRVTHGRMVVEIRPPIDVDKGTAVMNLVHEFGLKSALYLGDDVTDIDAFVALRRWREEGKGCSLSVAVLSSESGRELVRAADAYVVGVSEVERLLGWLAQAAAKLASRDPLAGDGATS